MRILLDECVNERLRNHLSRHDVQSVRYAGFSGLKNGELLDAAESAGFQVLLSRKNLFSSCSVTNVAVAFVPLELRKIVVCRKRSSRALKVSIPYVADIRSGKRVPHPRHWLGLAKLASVSEVGQY
jgi:hypothetical protein